MSEQHYIFTCDHTDVHGEVIHKEGTVLNRSSFFEGSLYNLLSNGTLIDYPEPKTCTKAESLQISLDEARKMIDSQSEKLSKLNEEMNIIFECNSDLEEKLYKEKKLKVKARIERNKLYKANQEQGKEISRQSTLDRLNEGNLNCLDYYRERIDVEGHEGELLKPECTQVDIRMSPELNQEFENIAMSFGDVMEALKENKDESIDPMDKLLPRLVFVGILSGVSLLVAIVAVCNSLI